MKPLSDMNEVELAALMRRVADAVKAELPTKTLYFVVAFDEPGVAQYIGNANRRDIIKAMRETADRLESRDAEPPARSA
jgi:hypothetical protein